MSGNIDGNANSKSAWYGGRSEHPLRESVISLYKEELRKGNRLSAPELFQLAVKRFPADDVPRERTIRKYLNEPGVKEAAPVESWDPLASFDSSIPIEYLLKLNMASEIYYGHGISKAEAEVAAGLYKSLVGIDPLAQWHAVRIVLAIRDLPNDHADRRYYLRWLAIRPWTYQGEKLWRTLKIPELNNPVVKPEFLHPSLQGFGARAVSTLRLGERFDWKLGWAEFIEKGAEDASSEGSWLHNLTVSDENQGGLNDYD